MKLNKVIDASRAADGPAASLLARAVIAAAAADGHTSARDRRCIRLLLDALALTNIEKRLLIDELDRPLKLHEVAEQALAMGAAMEVYRVSALIIDRRRSRGRVYLADLAEILALPPPLVRQIHEEVMASLLEPVATAVSGRAA
ncbi:MAG: DUF533 domain-containing protein [Pseudomonadales bacterium]